MSARTTILALALGALAAGCGGTEPGVNPLAATRDGGAPTSSAAAMPTATPFPAEDAGSGAPLADAGVAKRTVKLVNPFGGPAGNLFVDGDFETSTVAAGSSGQFGVQGFDATNGQPRAFAVETGGLCKSGLTCAVVDRTSLLFIRGASASLDRGVVARLAVKPPPNRGCNSVSAVLVACDTQQSAKKLQALPDRGPDGWCEQSAMIPPRDYALCLMVKTTLDAGETALVDAARLVPDDGTVAPRKGEIWVPDAATARELAWIGDHLRKNTRFGRPDAAPLDHAP
jgi:hypothetical protein